jgi:hypothetical protein
VDFAPVCSEEPERFWRQFWGSATPLIPIWMEVACHGKTARIDRSMIHVSCAGIGEPNLLSSEILNCFGRCDEMSLITCAGMTHGTLDATKSLDRFPRLVQHLRQSSSAARGPIMKMPERQYRFQEGALC